MHCQKTLFLIYISVANTDTQLYVISYLNVFYNYVNDVDTFWQDAYTLLFSNLQSSKMYPITIFKYSQIKQLLQGSCSLVVSWPIVLPLLLCTGGSQVNTLSLPLSP